VCVANKLSLPTSLLSRSAVVVAIGICCYRAYLDRSITPPTLLPPSLPLLLPQLCRRPPGAVNTKKIKRQKKIETKAEGI